MLNGKEVQRAGVAPGGALAYDKRDPAAGEYTVQALVDGRVEKELRFVIEPRTSPTAPATTAGGGIGGGAGPEAEAIAMADPAEGLRRQADQARVRWQEVVAQEMPKAKRECDPARRQASIKKMSDARGNYDAKNILLWNRYTELTLEGLAQGDAPQAKADSDVTIQAVEAFLKSAEERLAAKKEEQAKEEERQKAAPSSDADDVSEYFTVVNMLIQSIEQEVAQWKKTLASLKQAEANLEMKKNLWANLKEQAEESVRNVEAEAASFKTEYSGLDKEVSLRCAARVIIVPAPPAGRQP